MIFLCQSENEQKSQAETESSAACEDEQEEEEEEEDENALGDKDNSEPAAKWPPVTQEHIEQLAEIIKDDWKQLAAELAFPDDNIETFTVENEDKKDQALQMLTMWRVSCLISLWNIVVKIGTHFSGVGLCVCGWVRGKGNKQKKMQEINSDVHLIISKISSL